MSRKVWVPVVSGPLASYAAGFAELLESRGYSSFASADRLYQFDQLSRWMQQEALGVGELSDQWAQRFAASRRARGVTTWSAVHSAALPLEYLRGLGAALEPEPAGPRGALGVLLANYRRYLSVERGLCDHTVCDWHIPSARLFLTGVSGPDGVALERLSPVDVTAFLVRESGRRSRS